MKSLASYLIPFISFGITLIIAMRDHWSATDLACSFWLAGFLLGLIYVLVYQIAQGDRETLLVLPLVLIFFYFIFAVFLDTIFAFAAWDTSGQGMAPLFVTIPAAMTAALRTRWPFLLTSAITHLPDFILDARTVHFTDLSKPLFTREMFRMIILIFFLMALTMIQAGAFALYVILFIYFWPWQTVRQLVRPLSQRRAGR